MTDLSPEEERSRALEPNVAPGSGLGAGDQSALALPTSTTNISRRSSRSEESRSNSPSIDSLLEEGSYTDLSEVLSHHVGQFEPEGPRHEVFQCRHLSQSEDTATLVAGETVEDEPECQEQPNLVGVLPASPLHLAVRERPEGVHVGLPQILIEGPLPTAVPASPDTHGDSTELVVGQMPCHCEEDRKECCHVTCWRGTVDGPQEKNQLQLRSDWGVCVFYPPATVTYCGTS